MFDEVVVVTGNRPLSGSHFLLSVESPRQAQATRPGQFAMLRILGRSDVLLRRPMSIYDLKAGNSDGKNARRAGPSTILQFLYKVVGHGTQLMSELKPGNQIGLLAPLGHGFFEEDYLPRAHEADEILHVAGGIGIAALLLPAKRLAEAGFHQRLFMGGRSKADLVGVENFRSVVRGALLATEDGSAGYRGFVTRPLEEYLARHSNKIPINGLRALGHVARMRGVGKKVWPPVPGFHGKPHGMRPRGLPWLLHPRPRLRPRGLSESLHRGTGILGG